MGIFKNMKLKEECWNIDYSFLLWVNEHFKMYLKEADDVVDLTFHTYTYKRKILTQKDVINIIIRDTDWLINVYYDWSVRDDFKKEFSSTVNEVFDLFRMVFYNMWW